MNTWFKKFVSSIKLKPTPKDLNKYKSFFVDQCYWANDHQSIARGVAAGLAGSVIPGFQIFYAAILVFLLRGNLPIALLFTLITNPLTVAPITYFIYFIGTIILGNTNNDFIFKPFRWDFSSINAFWVNVIAWASQFGKGFLVGLPIVSICLGIIGYFGTIIVLKISSLLWYKQKK
jgi:uncharacterized protein (DUF2062 family)